MTALEIVASNRYMGGSLFLDELSSVPRDHAVLIGVHDANEHTAEFTGDNRGVRLVAVGIKHDPEELQAIANASTDLCLVLADAGREYQRV